jgi:hypothetical protein
MESPVHIAFLCRRIDIGPGASSSASSYVRCLERAGHHVSAIDDDPSRIPDRGLVWIQGNAAWCPRVRRLARFGLPDVPGRYFISAPVEQMPDLIRYYLNHEDERRVIVEEAHRFVTTEHTMDRAPARALDIVSNWARERKEDRFA